MRVAFNLRTPIVQSARVVQTASMFDLPLEQGAVSEVAFDFDAPIDGEREWSVGLIVGPSGAGKSSVARHLFGSDMIPPEGYPWHPERSVLDGFEKGLGVREVTEALSSVGFSSPPSWVKPYAVLSNGEKFRANMARALLDPRALVVADEYTSVVDRTVAKVGSYALAKAVRRTPGKAFVAVTCHYDVEEWLQPDWVIEPHVGGFHWRSVQRRPTIELEYVRVQHSAWRWFAPHHYMSADLNRSAKCFAALWDGRPVAFAGLLPVVHPILKSASRISRLVVLPDFQGIGLASHLFGPWLGRLAASNGRRLFIQTSHPTLVKTYAKSVDWKLVRAPKFSPKVGRTSTVEGLGASTATQRRIASFEWAGAPLPADELDMARRMWETSGAK